MSVFLKSQEIKEAKERKNLELLEKQLNKMTDTTRLNLLDRLLEVAKDFEAERFQDEVEHKKQLRAQQQHVEDVQQKLFEAESEIDGLKAEIDLQPMQDGDVVSTFADTELLENWINYAPTTSIEQGILKFIEWFKNYYKI